MNVTRRVFNTLLCAIALPWKLEAAGPVIIEWPLWCELVGEDDQVLSLGRRKVKSAFNSDGSFRQFAATWVAEGTLSLRVKGMRCYYADIVEVCHVDLIEQGKGIDVLTLITGETYNADFTRELADDLVKIGRNYMQEME